MGWYRKNGGSRPHPVGEKQPNDFGLHDMHGNVSEWCEDWFQYDFYQESTGARDPLCENSSSWWRVVRGGSWGDGAGVCRSAYRDAELQGIRNVRYGFRPAWSSP